jgi:hypothetical protein
MNKKTIIAAVVAVIVAVAAFFGGMTASDPKDSSEYKALARDLKDTEKDLRVKEEELASTIDDLADSESELTDAKAQLDALTSEALDSGVAVGEPAVSGGAAVAPRNFKIGVRIRSKECFGSAGCIVEVQIVPDYVGQQDVSTGSWELIYELRGGEDGPVIETMTLESGTFSFPEEQSLDTRSSSTPITAVVTEVYSLD